MSNRNQGSSGGCVGFLAVAAAIIGTVVAIAVMISAFTAFVVFFYAIYKGLTVPNRAFRNLTNVDVATPEKVIAGEVFRNQPSGYMQGFDWDPAWPNYFPYQMQRDFRAIRSELHHTKEEFSYRVNSVLDDNDEGFLAVGYQIVLLPARIIFTTIVTGAGWTAIALMWLFARVMQAIQGVLANLRTTREKKQRENLHADIMCTHCYRAIEMPAFRCPTCGALHRDLTPGRLGINERICQCHTHLPVGLLKASADPNLVAVCPHPDCNRELPAGTGTRRLVTVPVFGPVSAGKSWFLSSSALRLSQRHQDNKLVLLDQESNDKFYEWASSATQGRGPEKTSANLQSGVSLLLNPQTDNEVEIHLMDSAGENFFDMERTKSMHYFDHARTLVLIVDPLALEEQRLSLDKSQVEQYKPADEGSNGAYGAVVDRLRDGGVDVSQKRLAVVVTKADAINESSQFDPIAPNSDAVRDWLNSNGADELVRRIGFDFEDVQYFAVDSRAGTTIDPRFDPVHVLEWVAGQSLTPVLTAQNESADQTEKEHAYDQ